MDMSIDIMLKLFVAIGLSCHLCLATDVSKTDCTAGGTECSTISNSACVSTKCKCNAGYNESATTCAKVLGATCKIESDCSAQVPHSNCSSTTCSCLPQYQEKTNICVKSVSLTTCTNGNECSQIENAACASKKCKCNAGFKDTVDACTKVLGAACNAASDCTATVPNSACTTSKCTCSTGYGESDNLCAKPVSGTPCTKSGNECSSITNSACDVPSKKCKCDSGFKETVNKCTAESKAVTVSTTSTTALFGATFLVFAFKDLF